MGDAQYVVCSHRRNNPRLNIRICAKKCDLADECDAFIEATILYDLPNILTVPDPLAEAVADPLAGAVADPLAGAVADPLAEIEDPLCL